MGKHHTSKRFFSAIIAVLFGFQIACGSLVIPAVQAATGGDSDPSGYSGGYTFIDSNETGDPSAPAFGWVDISGDPGAVAVSLQDDENSSEVHMDFSFPFFNNDYTSVYIGSNGFLTFDPSAPVFSPGNSIWAMHNSYAYYSQYYSFYDGYDLDPTQGGNIYYLNDTTNNRFIVQYNQIHNGTNSATYSFETILYPNGEIVVQYNQIQDTSFYYYAYPTLYNQGQSKYLPYYNGLAEGLAIKFLPPNPNIPIVYAGADGVGILGSPTTLSGTVNVASGATPDILWSFESKPAESALTDTDITNGDQAQASFTPDVPGDYVLRLTATNTLGTPEPEDDLTRFDSVYFFVDDPNIPVVDAGSDSNGTPGNPKDLNGNVSVASSAPLDIRWTFDSKPSESALTDTDITNSDQAQASFTPDVVGSYYLRLSATNTFGTPETNDDIVRDDTVYINVFDNPITVNAGVDAVVKKSHQATLSGTASHENGNPLNYAWRLVQKPQTSTLTDSDINNASTLTPSFSPDAYGRFVLELKATDQYDSNIYATDTMSVHVPGVEFFNDSNYTSRLTSLIPGDTIYVRVTDTSIAEQTTADVMVTAASTDSETLHLNGSNGISTGPLVTSFITPITANNGVLEFQSGDSASFSYAGTYRGDFITNDFSSTDGDPLSHASEISIPTYKIANTGLSKDAGVRTFDDNHLFFDRNSDDHFVAVSKDNVNDQTSVPKNNVTGFAGQPSRVLKSDNQIYDFSTYLNNGFTQNLQIQKLDYAGGNGIENILFDINADSNLFPDYFPDFNYKPRAVEGVALTGSGSYFSGQDPSMTGSGALLIVSQQNYPYPPGFYNYTASVSGDVSIISQPLATNTLVGYLHLNGYSSSKMYVDEQQNLWLAVSEGYFNGTSSPINITNQYFLKIPQLNGTYNLADAETFPADDALSLGAVLGFINDTFLVDTTNQLIWFCQQEGQGCFRYNMQTHETEKLDIILAGLINGLPGNLDSGNNPVYRFQNLYFKDFEHLYILITRGSNTNAPLDTSLQFCSIGNITHAVDGWTIDCYQDTRDNPYHIQNANPRDHVVYDHARQHIYFIDDMLTYFDTNDNTYHWMATPVYTWDQNDEVNINNSDIGHDDNNFHQTDPQNEENGVVYWWNNQIYHLHVANLPAEADQFRFEWKGYNTIGNLENPLKNDFYLEIRDPVTQEWQQVDYRVNSDEDTDDEQFTVSVDMTRTEFLSHVNNDNVLEFRTREPDAFENGASASLYAGYTSVSSSSPVTYTLSGSLLAGGAPVANDDSATVAQDSTDNSIDVLANDTDPDGDTISIISVNPSTAGGTTSISGGMILYTPPNGFTGSDSFTYTIEDTNGNTGTGTVAVMVTSNVNNPTAFNDSYSVVQDTTLNIAAPGVLSNDTDPESDPLTAHLDSNVSNGSLTLNSDGSFDYTPNSGFFGTDTFTYHAEDPPVGYGGGNQSNSATVTITVTSNNIAPSALDDTYSVDEDGTLNIDAVGGVLANDTDADSDPLTAVLVNNVSNGTLVLNSDGSFTYIPDANFNGNDSFTYHANDSIGNSADVTVTITVNPVNDNPTPADDTLTTNEDTNLTFNGTDLTNNDTDIEGDTLTILLFTQPAHGTLTDNGDGTYTYAPDANYNGNDSFVYTVSDGNGGTGSATVDIIVNPQGNTAPIANDQSVSLDEDTFTNITLDVLDADGDPLSFTIDSNTINGTLIDLGNGVYQYTPNANFFGSDSFSYTASDGNGGNDTATVSITVNSVNDAPSAADDTYNVNEDNTLTIDAANGVLNNDSDIENDTLTAVLVNNVTNGTLALNSDGSFSYTPNANFFGSDSFTYHANDGTDNSNDVTVSINITSVNDNPVGLDDSYTTNEDTTLTIDAASGVLANDTDLDGDSLSVSILTPPAQGSLTLNSDGSFSFTPNPDTSGILSFTYSLSDGNGGSATASVSLTVNAVNDNPTANPDIFIFVNDASSHSLDLLANDSFAPDTAETLSIDSISAISSGALVNNSTSLSYTPNSSFYGVESFTYSIADGNGGTASSSVILVVLPASSCPGNVCPSTGPFALDDSLATNEDSNLSFSSASLLSNDFDIPPNTVSFLSFTQPSNGSLVDDGSGNLTYSPNPDFNGSDSFSYSIQNNLSIQTSATVSISVASINDAPTALTDSYSTNEDTTLTVDAISGLLANDTDLEGDSLTAVLVNDVTNGTLTFNSDGSFSYVPNANYNGTDSFTYHASDGTDTSADVTVSINITSVNDNPVSIDDSYTTNEDTTLTIDAVSGVLANDTDLEGDSLTAVLVNDVTNGTLTFNSDGSFSYVPNANYNGTDSFTYHASDGTDTSADVTVTLTVNSINDNPVGIDDSYTTDEDTTLNITAPGVLGNDTDTEGNSLSAILVNDVTHGTLTFNSDGSFSYTPDANFFGSDSFTYHANDGTSDSNDATITITINSVNDDPFALGDVLNTSEDTSLTFNAGDLTGNDTDTENDTLSILSFTQPGNGTLVDNGDGTYSYFPNTNFNGTDTFSYTVSDGNGGTSSADVSIDVLSVNDTPFIQDDSTSVNEDSSNNSILVLNNDSDDDGDTITIDSVSAPANGSATINDNGTPGNPSDDFIEYTPDSNFSGTDSFSYTASDGNGGSGTATVTVTINSLNDAPVALDDSYSVDEDGTLNGIAPGVLGNDSDADSDSLTPQLVSGPTHAASFTLNNDGSFSYIPAADFNGTDSFSYQANDGVGYGGGTLSNTATVTITINSINDAPAALDDAYSTNEDTTLTVDATSGVLANDTDLEGNSLTAVLVNDVTNGTLTFNSDGSFSYVPNDNYNGTDSFTYHASDGTDTSADVTVSINIASVNDNPVGVDDSYTTNEDTTLTIDAVSGVLANDTDLDGDSLSVSILTPPAQGSLTLNSDGSFSFTPNPDTSGTLSFTYSLSDGNGGSATASVSLTVNAVNDNPTANPDIFIFVNDASSHSLDLLANDSFAPDTAETLSIDSLSSISSGSLSNNSSSVSYTPNPSFYGVESFTYSIADGNGGTASSSVILVVLPASSCPGNVCPSAGPFALDDSLTTNEDSNLSFSSASLLSNDFDIPPNTISFLSFTQPSNGSLVDDGGGNLTYSPNPDFNGSDSFSYSIQNNLGVQTSASVSISVASINDNPVAQDDTMSGTEDTTLTFNTSDLVGNDSDADNDSLSILSFTQPANGTLVDNGNGTYTYTPDSNFNGSDTFSYTISDGNGGSSTGSVTLNISSVNDTPVAVSDSYTVDEDMSLSVAGPGVLGNDSDDDNDSMTSVLVSGPSHGSLIFNSDGSFSYTPDANYNGDDSFTYHSNDGTADSSDTTVTLTINPVNDPPNGSNDLYTTDKNNTLNVAGPGVLSNDSDTENDSLTVSLISDVSHGTLTFNSDGSFSYIPDLNYVGSDSFVYHSNDGTDESADTTVTIAVNEANSTPQANADTYTLDEDTTLDVPAAGVLTNDTDLDNGTLTTVVVDGPDHGSLTLNSDGSFSYTPDADFNGTDSFTYAATDGTDTSAATTVTLTIDAVNDQAVANADSYSVSEDETLEIAAPGVLSNDTDTDGDSLISTLISGPGSGSLTLNSDGSFSYTPNADFSGTDSFIYCSSDGIFDPSQDFPSGFGGPFCNGTQAEVTITVLPANDNPVATSDNLSSDEDNSLTFNGSNLTGNDTDSDGDTLTITSVTNPTHGTLTDNGDGTYTYIPDPDFSGSDSFTYTVSDGNGGSSTGTVSINISSVNDLPNAQDDNYSVDEDGSLTVPSTGVLSNDSDTEGDNLSVTVQSGTSNGSLSLNSDGSFSYTPDADFSGTDSFTYCVSDTPDPGPQTYHPNRNLAAIFGISQAAAQVGCSGSTATVYLTINALNDNPVANNDNLSATEDTNLTFNLSELTGNDTDGEGDTLSVVSMTQPAHGTLTDNGDGTVTYTPDGNYNGSDSFTYTISDGNGGSSAATVNVTISSVNDLPQAQDDSYSLTQNGNLEISGPGVLSNDSDADNDPLIITVETGTSHGSLNLNSDGSFSYTPDPNFSGSDSFTYCLQEDTNSQPQVYNPGSHLFAGWLVESASAQSNCSGSTGTVTLSITNGNHAPAATPQNITTTRNHAVNITLGGTDEDNDTLTWIIVQGPAHGSLTGSGPNRTYTPTGNFTGTDTFTFKVNDSQLDSSVVTVTINVNNLNSGGGGGGGGGIIFFASPGGSNSSSSSSTSTSSGSSVNEPEGDDARGGYLTDFNATISTFMDDQTNELALMKSKDKEHLGFAIALGDGDISAHGDQTELMEKSYNILTDEELKQTETSKEKNFVIVNFRDLQMVFGDGGLLNSPQHTEGDFEVEVTRIQNQSYLNEVSLQTIKSSNDAFVPVSEFAYEFTAMDENGKGIRSFYRPVALYRSLPENVPAEFVHDLTFYKIVEGKMVAIPTVVDMERHVLKGITYEPNTYYVGINTKLLRYQDVQTSTESHDNIYDLTSSNIVSGYAAKPGWYGPKACVLRSEMVKMAVGAFDTPKPPYMTPRFKDTPRNAWFTPFITAAVDRGILSTVNDFFYPNNCVTRKDAVKIMVLAGNFPYELYETGDTVFSDVFGSDYFRPYLSYAVQFGIVKGYEDNTFHPDENLRRDDVTSVLANAIRMYNRYGRHFEAMWEHTLTYNGFSKNPQKEQASR